MLTRREFIGSTAVAAGILALRPAPAWAGEKDKFDMAIARFGGAQPDAAGFKTLAEKLTTQAIAALGGMERFVKRGSVVWIKPNIGWDRKPENAADTNPDVVATLVKLCFTAGAKAVKIGDYTCNDARRCYENSGISGACKPLGAEMLLLDKNRAKQMDLKGEKLKLHPVFPEMVECDLLINVPIVKHHGSTRRTMCMKNYMGCMNDRGKLHQDLPTTISDLTRFLKPRLCVLDGVRILTDHGPTGGDLKDVQFKGALAAGTDIVALDAWGAELSGLKPADIGTIMKGQAYGLGTADYRKLALKEIAVS